MNKKELEYRTRNLNPEYEMRVDYDRGLGLFSTHKETGCSHECEMDWDEEGETLACTICGFDGT